MTDLRNRARIQFEFHEMTSERERRAPFHIYFVQRGNRGPIKIGQASDVGARLRDLQCGSAEQLQLRGVIFDEGGTESELHQRFAAYRLEGEWFEPEKIEEFIALIPLVTEEEAVRRVGVVTPRLALQATSKPCSGCHQTKPLDQFYKQRHAPLGRMSACKTCYRERFDQAYFAKYREQQALRLKKSRNNHKYSIKQQVVAALGRRCVCCEENLYELLHAISKDASLKTANYTELARTKAYSQYQLLCWNCWLSRKHNGYCPHWDSVI
jgi:hypothetical protein